MKSEVGGRDGIYARRLPDLRHPAAESDSKNRTQTLFPAQKSKTARGREREFWHPPLPLPHNRTATLLPPEPCALDCPSVYRAAICRGAWSWASSETARATVAVASEASSPSTLPSGLHLPPLRIAALTYMNASTATSSLSLALLLYPGGEPPTACTRPHGNHQHRP